MHNAEVIHRLWVTAMTPSVQKCAVGDSGPACPLGCQLNTLLPQQVGREYWLRRVLDNLYIRVLPNMLTVL